MSAGECFYHGCGDGPGHYLWDERGSRLRGRHRLPKDFPCQEAMLDSGFLPPNLPMSDGEATLATLNGWTVLSFWDRSVDTRPGCNSTFVIPAVVDFQAAKRIAQERFPWVWERIKFDVRERGAT